MPASKTIAGIAGLLRREGQRFSQIQSKSYTTNASAWSSAMPRQSRLQSTKTWGQLRSQTYSRIPSLRGNVRTFTATPSSRHGHWTPPKPGEEVYVTFIEKDGTHVKLPVNIGDDLLSIAQEHDIEMEGACEGSCSCSTCHVIVQDEAMFDQMEEAGDDENDMLDIAFGLTETSRLGCQIKMTKELDGLVVKLPLKTRNMQKSDFQ